MSTKEIENWKPCKLMSNRWNWKPGGDNTKYSMNVCTQGTTESPHAYNREIGRCRHRILSARDLRVEPRKFQKYYLFSKGPRKHLYWRDTTRSGIRALKMPFQVKLNKMPLVNPGLTESQTRSKSSRNNIFHAFTSNSSHSEIFVNFDQVWPDIVS